MSRVVDTASDILPIQLIGRSDHHDERLHYPQSPTPLAVQLARLTFLETIHLDCLHNFLPEGITVGLSHRTGGDVRVIPLVYVLTSMNTAISDYLS